MAAPLSGRRRASLVAAVGLAAQLACETPPSATVPQAQVAPPVRILGDERAMALCQDVTIVAQPPRRVGNGGTNPSSSSTCGNIEFHIDVSVETGTGEAMILSMFRAYQIRDWRFRSAGGRYRHDFSLLWAPYDFDALHRSSFPEVRPMSLVACPEGERGPVLACTDVRCALYDDEDALPSFVLPETEVIVRSPWGFGDVQEVAEGESLVVPMSYSVLRSRHPAQPPFRIVVFAEDGRDQEKDYEVRPLSPGWFTHTDGEHLSFELSGLDTNEPGPLSGMAVFEIMATRDGKREGAEPDHVGVSVSGVGCVVYPNIINLRITDSP